MSVPWWSLLPFAALLACISTFPLLKATAHLWERRLFQLAVALALGLPMALWMTLRGEGGAVLHAVVEYAQFIALLFSLFVISGGVYFFSDLRPTPKANTLVLALGAIIGSFVGTTGAAMLLIRPLLQMNGGRTHKIHTVIFAIFIVANTGGLLTPLGDPPLFLGLLRGVPFWWTLKLALPWLFVNTLLLLTYYSIDAGYFAGEAGEEKRFTKAKRPRLHVRGAFNLLLLAGVVASVATLPSIDLDALHHGTGTFTALVPWRELVLLALAALSYFAIERKVRFRKNHFSFGPIAEVAALFIGIFLTMVPALKFLAEVAPSLHLNAMTFYLATGSLSSVLDNAPTYATFFEIAKQLPGENLVAGVPELFLTAISLGAVLFGAMTYIGNGPNFMVKAIADSRGVKMPSFGAYIAKWSLLYLAPTLLSLMLILFSTHLAVKLVGVAGALFICAAAIWRVRRAARREEAVASPS